MTIRANRSPDATTRGQKRIFAVVSRPVTVSGKTIRHIVIFDNHPATLRLLLGTDPFNMGRTRVLLTPQRASGWYIILGIILVVLVAAGMFWPLLNPR
jgi:hypothetical protein